MPTTTATTKRPSQGQLATVSTPLATVRDKQATMVYHFVGIGGCGMSGLAQVLHQQGHRVSGSDAQTSTVVERLGRRGISVHIGHHGEQVPPDANCLVVSAAIKDDNPELLQARQRRLPILKYAQLLGRLTRQMHTLAIAGTHGKSTTSGWLAYMLERAGRSPSFVIGADVEQLGGGSGAGHGTSLVVEACEYDRSFLNLHPTAAAILNIERDHLDYYRDLDDIIDAFNAFAGQVKPQGLLVTNADDDSVKAALKTIDTRCENFSLTGAADWQADRLSFKDGHGCFELTYRGQALGPVELSVPGRHNVANALAVAALGHHAQLSPRQIRSGLNNYVGVGRRMSYRGEVGGVVILDDYAHHPTEIQTTLEAARNLYQPRRLWCVFQPHQHSRTRFLLEEFAGSFAGADVVLLGDIYFVRDSEATRREISADRLAERITAWGGQAHYLGDFDAIVAHLCREASAGDAVITMGAGDIWKLGDELIRGLGRDR